MTTKPLSIPTKHGRWTVLSEVEFRLRSGKNQQIKYCVVCKCTCGTVRTVYTESIRRDKTKSCGCYQSESMKSRMKKHGYFSGHLKWLYARAADQQSRCTRPNDTQYHVYGAKGTKFMFESIAEAVSYYSTLPNCKKEYHIDRIDNNGHYERGNVRFVPNKTNQRNKSTNRFLTAFGKTMPLVVWAEQLGMKTSSIYSRLRNGWSVEETLSTPVGIKTRRRRRKSNKT